MLVRRVDVRRSQGHGPLRSGRFHGVTITQHARFAGVGASAFEFRPQLDRHFARTD